MVALLSNKINRDELKPGDHIYSWRHGFVYSHHGIYVGDERVIHFTQSAEREAGTGTFLDRFIFSSSAHSLKTPCPRCGDQSNASGVISSCLDCFLSGGELYLFEYDVSAATFLAKVRGGTCTLAKSDPTDFILHRAKFLLQNGFGVYNLFKKNCEDFAIYCKTGLLKCTSVSLGLSGQASSFVAAANAVVSLPLRFMTTRVPGLAVVGLGIYCLSRLASDIGVRHDVIKVPVERLISQDFDPTVQTLESNSTAPQSSEANILTSVVMDDEQLKNQRQEQEKQLIEGFGNCFDSENALNEDVDEENYGTEERENVGDPMVSQQDLRYNDGKNYGKGIMYPVRPDAEDCSFHMKTGNCKFEANCEFYRPPRRRNQDVNKEKLNPKAEDSERPVQTECKYYLTSWGCRFGKACKYSHSMERSVVAPVAPILEFNFLGLPIRLGEKECPYYMRTGSCKHGSNCRFNHPDPSASGPDPAPGYGNGGSVHLQGASQSSPVSCSSVPMTFPPTQATPPSNPEWKSHQMQIDEYPERPGQPECRYFLRTGACKYKSNCRYHHPKIRLSKPTSCPLSEKGLPLRPVKSICRFYSRYGNCKYGPACKFDHPENWVKPAPSDGARW